MIDLLRAWAEAIGRFVRDNSTTFVLLVLFVGLLGFTLHMSHDSMDKEMVSWGREEAGTVLGALLLLLKAQVKSADPKETVTQTTITAKHIDAEMKPEGINGNG